MAFELPQLNYTYDALEPVFDARTMEIHHTKHHQTYIDNLNKAIQNTQLENKSIEEICSLADTPALRNNGGGHYNHSLFWEILTPNGAKSPIGNVKTAIENYGSFEKFKIDFSEVEKNFSINIDSFFEINNFNNYFLQDGIDFYNKII